MNEVIKFSSANVEEDEVQRRVLIILSERNYEICGCLGMGTFGTVLKVRGPCGQELAAKFIHLDRASTGEMVLWKTLHHPNVMPLIEVIEDPAVAVFVMPVYPQNLLKMLETRYLRGERGEFEWARGWIRDILRGLEYLQNLSLCHLDMKEDNILISEANTAIITDFTFLASSKDLVSSYGLPPCLRPPETFISLKTDPLVDGRAFDIWSVGVLAYHLLTLRDLSYTEGDQEKIRRHSWNRDLANENYWGEYVYPTMYRNLQPCRFRELISESFPLSTITQEAAFKALNFLTGVFRYQPCERPEVSVLKRHAFLEAESSVVVEPLLVDTIWFNKKAEREDEAVRDSPNCEASSPSGAEKGEDLEMPDESGLQSSDPNCLAVRFRPVASEKSGSDRFMRPEKRNLKVWSFDATQIASEPPTRCREVVTVERSQSDSALAGKERRVDYRPLSDSDSETPAKKPSRSKRVKSWIQQKFKAVKKVFTCQCVEGQKED